MKKIFLFSLLVFSQLHSQAVNTTLYGVFAGRGSSDYSSCYGYTAPNGREYAILGCYTGTSIIDITEKPIKEVSFIPGPNSLWREMKVYNNYAYVVTEGSGNGAGLQIIDLTKPDSTKLVNTFQPNINGRNVTTNHTVSIEGKYLYLNGSKPGIGGIIVLDLTNPINPIALGEYQNLYVHDCSIYNDTIYAAGIYGQGLDIIDATNKSNMKRIKLVSYSGAGTHNTDMTIDGKYVLTTDEIGSQNIMRIWDKTDINNIQLVSTYHAKPQTIIHNAHVKGNYAYIAHYSEGLRIVDLTNPTVPVEVASYDTYPGSANNYVGAWGAFPYFNSNKVLISDMTSGLTVVEFNSAQIKAARGIITLTDSVTNLPISDVRVELLENGNVFTSNIKGEVGIGYLKDTVTLRLSKSTYLSGYLLLTKKIILSYDSLKKIEIKMKSLPVGLVNGKIINSVTNEPIKKFPVRISKTNLSVQTDSLGIFNFGYLLGDTTYTFVATGIFGYLPDSVSKKIITNSDNNIQFKLTPKFYDNFEYDLGWTVGNQKDSGFYGIWARSRAVAYSFLGLQAQPTNHTSSGVMALVTGGQSGTSTQNVDGRTTITSPTFFPKDYTQNIFVKYWRWFFTSSNNIGEDSLITQITNDNGITWKTIEVISSRANSWIESKIKLNDFVNITPTMQIRFIAVDGGPSSVVESVIDDLWISDQLTDVIEDNIIPEKYLLEQNYPNPFNPTTTIKFSIPFTSNVNISVFDVLGRKVETLINGKVEVGNHKIKWNGVKFQSGTYFYKIQSGGFTETKKLILIK